MIQINNLFVNYRWRSEPVLKGISGTFNRKSLILGPNGSGKTTLFRAICGLTNITEGDIIIDGKSIEELYSAKGFLSSNFHEIYTLLDSNVHNLIILYSDLFDGDAISTFKYIEELGLSLKFIKNRKLNELSAGQLKIVCTAFALTAKTKHVLLDEPFEQLDPSKKSKLIRYLQDHQGIIVINTHETWLLRNFRDWDVFFMFEGVLHGGLCIEDLLESNIVFTDEPDALLKIQVANKIMSILPGTGKGTLLTSLENLDRIYDLTAEGS
ncbi:MAG: ATP-binding cassette domain-containing protein [Candidatus Helarchaeota archaeon]